MKSKCIKNNMTNNNQLFFLFKIMTYNSHLFFCVWKHDKLGGGCLVFTSFYGSSNNKSWTSIYVAMKYNLFPFIYIYIYIYIHKRKLNHHKKDLLHNGTKLFSSFLHLSYAGKKTILFVNFLLLCHVVNLSTSS
jgi:hypothetical protein